MSDLTIPAVPAGVIHQYAGASAPDGYLLCDGSVVSRGDYANLFDAIGTAYGAGDGSTTFGIPDFRGRVPAGQDDMGGTAASRLTSGGSGVDGATLGATGGAETHTMTTTEMPSHTHIQNAHTHTQNSHNHSQNGHYHGGLSYAGGGGGPPGPHASWTVGGASAGAAATFGLTGQTTATNIATTATNQNTTATNQNTGGGGAHNNVQPVIVTNYIIKT